MVKLIGGLGNQMFQYAAGRSLAQSLNTELYLDTRALEADPGKAFTKRYFELGAWHINAKQAPQDILNRFSSADTTLARQLQRMMPFLFNTIVFNERGQDINPAFFRLRGNVYLNGYWQSEAYFLSIREMLHREFTLPDENNEVFLAYVKQIVPSNAVSLHVRRGDLLSHAANLELHGVLDLDYYRRAAEELNRLDKSPKTYFVFSDDLNWCRQNLGFLPAAQYVDSKNKMMPYHEIILMSHCRYNIIANSSFSWWGAWLNKNPDKIVIAPQNWFRAKSMSSRDLIPASWKRVA
ncbi:MAG TPA: alpha-1,2-fucosyltransferase [Bacteroidia bacterium]|nr:alpha-1,2-fucosyltransferase [Bacteroidia bacterium]